MDNSEIFSKLATIPPVFVRLDGRAFHGLTRKYGFAKPFDDRFCEAMVGVSVALVAESGLAPIFAYTFSDEIELVFQRSSLLRPGGKDRFRCLVVRGKCPHACT